MREWLYGRNPVYEALRSGRRQFFRLKIAAGVKEKERIHDILLLCRQKQVPIESTPRTHLDATLPNNQGVALEASGYSYSTLQDIMISAGCLKEAPLVLILDALQDPQNLGTLLRTAEAVGVHGVLLPLRQTTLVTPAVVSSSSGACEHLLIAQENLAQAITWLKNKGVWVIGLVDSPEAQPPEQIKLDAPLALVVGSEGRGMRRLVRESCDLLMCLPTRGQVESLNAAVAGSIGLYLAYRSRTIDVSLNS
jgi:23S rRNA (guanosine2251-2'-O)-methyltransferase